MSGLSFWSLYFSVMSLLALHVELTFTMSGEARINGFQIFVGKWHLGYLKGSVKALRAQRST